MNTGTLPTGLEFDAATHTFNGNHLGAGQYLLQVTAGDGKATATNQFELDVKSTVVSNGKGAFIGGNSAELITGRNAGSIDVMDGGKGDDTYIVDNAKDKITESSKTGGSDLVKSSINYTLGKNLENLTLTGGANQNLKGIGNELANTLTGDDGNNVLDGGKGIDIYIGGKGNDTYLLDNLAETRITEFKNEGNDGIQLKTNGKGSYTMPDNIETLIITGTGSINVTGSAQDNVITGNAKANQLLGAEGNDNLFGGNGNDSLQGGDGNDLLNGGLGKDMLIGGNGADQFIFANLLGKTNVDTITDFVSGLDSLKLDTSIFKKLAGDKDLSDNLVIGNKAADVNDYLVYNNTTGSLYYDVDGSGKKPLVLVGIFNDGAGHHPDLLATDFLI